MITEKNHELFRKFYGDYEYNRLKPIFNIDVADLKTGESWEIPPVTQDPYHMRLLVVAGLGSMTFLKKLMQMPAITKQISCVILVENDPAVISNIVNHVEAPGLIANPYVRFIFNHQKDTFKPALFNVLKQPIFSEVMELAGVFHNNREPDEVLKAFYASVDELVQETVQHVYHNYGRIDDSLEGIRSTLANHSRIVNHQGIEELKDLHKGKPALVIGAGPSLDKEIELIKANQNKFMIFAADAAVKPLINQGIRVDYCTSIERGNIFQKPFWTDLDPKETTLICYPVVHPEVLDLYKGTIRFVYRNYAWYAYFEKNWPKGVLHSGGSTSNLAIRLAHFMGCSEIILVGIDNSYEKNEEGLYRSHCQGTGYEDWHQYRPLEEFMTARTHQPPFETLGNDCSLTMTNMTYYQWAKEFAEELFSLNIPITTTASKGVQMAGIPYRLFKDICESKSEISFSVTPSSTVTLGHKAWSNDLIEESLEGWHRVTKTLNEILKEDISNDEMIYRGVLEAYNRYFPSDDLFVSFVLQNCAVEYYQSINAWNGLGTEIIADIEKKRENLHHRLFMFESVIEKLKGIFKAYG